MDSQVNKKVNGELFTDVSLARYTSWRVGGKAKYLYKPANLADLVCFLQQHNGKRPFLWLGLGSNTLIRDRGFSGTVIVTHPGLQSIRLAQNHTVRVEAGVSCASMARFCARRGLQGAEFLAGIPGTMGGALRMNAGCFGGETWERILEVETIDDTGGIRYRTCADYQVGYRNITGPQTEQTEWFVAATCQLTPGDKNKSLSIIRDLLLQRANTQPTGEYTSGSVFKNPKPEYAGALIESCGLKGYRIGGCYVSEKHANFIVNDGTAKAADLEDLIQYVSDQVLKRTGILLQPEVKIVGER